MSEESVGAIMVLVEEVAILVLLELLMLLVEYWVLA